VSGWRRYIENWLLWVGTIVIVGVLIWLLGWMIGP
jgi:nicotinamide riboside transporter PnuC